jgi:cytochrome c553
VFSSYAGALALLASAAAPPGLSGLAIVQNGNGRGAPACGSCHGAHLEGAPAIKAPALAGRPAAYIVARLAHYASPAGHNAMMKGVATSLAPAERQAVAAYIARLPKPKPPAA